MAALGVVQARQQRPLAAQQPVQRRIHLLLSPVGEGDQDAALVPRVGLAADESLDRIRAARRAPSPRSQAAEAPADGARPSAAEERTARKELQRLERQLDRLTAREADLSAELAANATDYEKLTSLGAELKAAQAEKADLEERWLTVAAQLDG